MKKILVFIISFFLFVLIAQNSWAVQLTYQSGEIYAEIGTNYPGRETLRHSNGQTSADQVVINDVPGVAGNAGGYRTMGSDDSVHFVLSTTAQSMNGIVNPVAHSTYALARSGENSNSMIKFKLDATGDEVVGQGVELTASVALAGSLSRYYFNQNIPEASFDFVFEVYRQQSDINPVIKFHYSDEAEGNYEFTYLPQSLGSKDDNTFRIGDSFYVYFQQEATAMVSGDTMCSANAYGVQSNNALEGVSLALEAHVIPNPEPSSLILLGFGFLGLLIGVPGIKKTFGKDA